MTNIPEIPKNVSELNIESSVLTPTTNLNVIESNYVCPLAKSVIYDLNTSKEFPILTTIVYFVDGTKITVRNNRLDAVDLVTKKLSDGTEIKVASDSAKEHGYVYACYKRSLTLYKDGLEFSRPNLENHFKTIINEYSHDLAYDRAEKRIAKERSKAAHEEKMRKAKESPKPEKLSIKQTLKRINDFIDILSSKSNVVNCLTDLSRIIKQACDDIDGDNDFNISCDCDCKDEHECKCKKSEEDPRTESNEIPIQYS